MTLAASSGESAEAVDDAVHDIASFCAAILIVILWWIQRGKLDTANAYRFEFRMLDGR